MICFCVYFAALVMFTVLSHFLLCSCIPLRNLKIFSSQAAAMGVCVCWFYSLFNVQRNEAFNRNHRHNQATTSFLSATQQKGRKEGKGYQFFFFQNNTNSTTSLLNWHQLFVISKAKFLVRFDYFCSLLHKLQFHKSTYVCMYFSFYTNHEVPVKIHYPFRHIYSNHLLYLLF